jgi:hypothetical protein
MAARRTTFGKTQREREKRAKQVAKRERKQAMSEVDPDEETTTETAATPPVDQEAVISQLEKLHERYADGGLSLEDFETAREELLARLTV